MEREKSAKVCARMCVCVCKRKTEESKVVGKSEEAYAAEPKPTGSHPITGASLRAQSQVLSGALRWVRLQDSGM